MTREEAIAILNENRPKILWEDKETQERMGNLCKALDVAIKALKQEPCIQEKQANADKIDAVYIDGFKAGYSQARFDLGQEPCEDAINREAVCNIVNDIRDCISVEGYWAIFERLKKLPSVNPQPKTGHWIVASDGYGDNSYICECSECKDTVWVYKDADRKWNYCPNCGARMESEG